MPADTRILLPPTSERLLSDPPLWVLLPYSPQLLFTVQQAVAAEQEGQGLRKLAEARGRGARGGGGGGGSDERRRVPFGGCTPFRSSSCLPLGGCAQRRLNALPAGLRAPAPKSPPSAPTPRPDTAAAPLPLRRRRSARRPRPCCCSWTSTRRPTTRA
jgi:hypothetical protein